MQINGPDLLYFENDGGNFRGKLFCKFGNKVPGSFSQFGAKDPKRCHITKAAPYKIILVQ